MTGSDGVHLPPPLGVGSFSVGFKTSPQRVDWPTLDAAWAAAGELDVFAAGWLNDHLTDPSSDAGGASWESLTLAAALAHRVPGKWVGHGVLANTFRHPSVLAKAATLLDHVTGGRFVLGLGAGWHVGEHETLGIPLPPMRERFGRYESAVETLTALFSAAAALAPGVTRDDPFVPLRGATNEPPPLRPGGPPIWLGGQGPRGIRLVARLGDGWMPSGEHVGDAGYFAAKRSEVLAALEAEARDPSAFAFLAQVSTGTTAADRRTALDQAVALGRAGATHVVLSVPAGSGADGIRAAAAEVAVPLREALG